MSIYLGTKKISGKTTSELFAYGMVIRSNNNVLNSPYWVRSDGAVKKGATYSGFYDYLKNIYNNGLTTTYKDTDGNEYTAKILNGVVILNNTDWASIYQNYGYVAAFGIDTTLAQFYLPYNKETRVLLEKKESNTEDGRWYNLYSDGWYEEGETFYKGSSVAGTTTINFKKQFKDTNYYFNGNAVYYSASSTPASVLENYTARTTTSTSFYIAGGFYGYQWEVKGYIDTTYMNYYDYYYVGV